MPMVASCGVYFSFTNIVTFIPATETNITNSRNGETVAVRGWRLQLKETH